MSFSVTLTRSSFTPDLTHRTGYKSEDFNVSKFETFFCTHKDGRTNLIVYDGKMWSEIHGKSSMEVLFHDEQIKALGNALGSLVYAEFIEKEEC